MYAVAHRQGPVDAGHLGLQPEQVHEEENQENNKEPQGHDLKVLERIPVGPATGTVHAKEGDQQSKLGKTQKSTGKVPR